MAAAPKKPVVAKKATPKATLKATPKAPKKYTPKEKPPVGSDFYAKKKYGKSAWNNGYTN